MYCIGRGLFEIKFYFLGKQGGKIWNQETPSSFSSQGKREVHQISNEATPFDVNNNFTSVLDQSLEANY
jgi:hypothetical protein